MAQIFSTYPTPLVLPSAVLHKHIRSQLCVTLRVSRHARTQPSHATLLGGTHQPRVFGPCATSSPRAARSVAAPSLISHGPLHLHQRITAPPERVLPPHVFLPP